MEAKQIPLIKLLEDKVRFNIPVYQRNYDWKYDQCKQLFSDIEQIYIDKDTRESHFLGTIVYIDSFLYSIGVNQLVVIDGQQRLTTVMLLLKAVYDSMEDTNSYKQMIYKSYFINEFESDPNKKLKLKLMKLKQKLFLN